MPSQVILLAIEGPMKGRSVILADKERVVFGRSRDCGKGLMPADDQLISRKHFMVEADLPRIRVWDLDSKHGTQVIKPSTDGKPARIVQVTANRASGDFDLRPGESIRAGQTLFEIQVVPLPKASPDQPEVCPECGRALAEEVRGGKALPLALFCRACLDLEQASAEEPHDLDAQPASPAKGIPIDPAPARGQARSSRQPAVGSTVSQGREGPLPDQGKRGHLRVSPGDGPPLVRGFRVEKKLGDGGFGSSFLCQRSSDGAPVVLKVVRFELDLAAPARSWLEEHSRGLLNLSHEKLVRLDDFGISAPGEEGTAVCLAQEYCPGGNILQGATARGGRLPPHVVYDLMGDALDALTFLHERGVVHGQVTPQNLLLASSEGAGPLKVGDAVLASLWHHLGVTRSGSQSGAQSSSGFPWQKQPAHPGLASMAADVWSAAAVFRYLLRGPLPARTRRSASAPRPAKRACASDSSRGDLAPEGLAPLFELLDQGLGWKSGPGFPTAREMLDALQMIPRPLVVTVS